MHKHKCVYMKEREKKLFIDKFMLMIIWNSKDMITKNFKIKFYLLKKKDPALMAYILSFKGFSLWNCCTINECLFLISVKVCSLLKFFVLHEPSSETYDFGSIYLQILVKLWHSQYVHFLIRHEIEKWHFDMVS